MHRIGGGFDGRYGQELTVTHTRIINRLRGPAVISYPQAGWLWITI